MTTQRLNRFILFIFLTFSVQYLYSQEFEAVEKNAKKITKDFHKTKIFI